MKWWMIPLVCAIFGTAIGYTAGTIVARLPGNVSVAIAIFVTVWLSVAIAIFVTVWLWLWAFRSIQELKIRKQFIDEQVKILQDLLELHRKEEGIR